MTSESSRISRRPLLLSATCIGLAAASLNFWIHTRVAGFTDFDQIWSAARLLLHGGDPYALVVGGGWPFFYPLPAVLIGVPFAPLDISTAAAVWTGIGFALLAYGLARDGWWRLLALCSLPAIESAQLAQWSPLLTASFLIPALSFLVAAKPTTAAPLVLSSLPRSLNRVSLAVGLSLLALSFGVRPAWLDEWIMVVRSSHHFVPLVFRPGGFVLLLALLRWRRPEAWLLALIAVAPQAGMAYDALPLAVLPSSRREAMFLAFASLAVLPWQLVAQDSGATFVSATAHNAPRYLLAFYVPALILIIRRPNERASPKSGGRR